MLLDLEGVFAILASQTRIRILHALMRDRELAVGEIVKRVGMKPAAVSNQLRLMAAKGIIGSRDEGQKVYYFMVDPCVPKLLDMGACLAVESQRRR